MPFPRMNLHLRNKLGELDRLYREVEAFAHTHHIPNGVLPTIQLALEEVVSNIIRHGYTDSREHVIDVSLRLDPRELLLEIEDDGMPFDLTQAPEVNLEVPLTERRVGGLGIYLVRQLMDRVECERCRDHNVVRLHKHLGD